MDQKRLTKEAVELNKFFPNRFKFENYGKSDPYLDVGVRSTTQGKIYRLRIELNNFPYACPSVFITHPTPIKDRNGNLLSGVSHSMHTLAGKNGWVQLCHYSKTWSSNVSLFKIVMKAKVWIEAYEGHLMTGNSIDHYVKGNY